MDCRQTLNTNETFLEILETCLLQEEKVNLLVDENGVSKAAGKIKVIQKTTAAIFIELDTGRKIELKNIVAVNGVFRPEYGEC